MLYIEKYFFNMDRGGKKVPVEGSTIGDIVYVVTDDDPGLYHWWAAMSGYTKYNGSIPKKYGKKAEVGTEQHLGLEAIGVSLDEEAIKEAIENGYAERWDKKNKKKAKASTKLASLLKKKTDFERPGGKDTISRIVVRLRLFSTGSGLH